MKTVKPTDWEVHFQSCMKCSHVDIQQIATLANACFVGAKFLREHLAKLASKNRPREARDPDEKKLPQFVVRERYTITEIDKKTDKPVKVEKQKTIPPVCLQNETANEFLALAKKTMGGDASRFFIAQR